MNTTASTTILSAEGFSARGELVAHAEAKASKLRRHKIPRVGQVRIHLRLDASRAGLPQFTASATAETRGLDFVAHSAAPAPETAINLIFVKLEREVSAAAGIQKHRLHQTSALEMAVD